MLRLKWIILIILIIALLLPHVFSFTNGYVDLEFVIVSTASEIKSHGFNAELDYYFSKEANPLLNVFILSAIYFFFGENPLVSRLTTFAFAFVFVLFLYYYLKKKEEIFIAATVAMLVITNPLFIVYSQYISNDIIYMVFLSAALLVFFYSNSNKSKVISSVLLGLSLATKYVTVVVFPVICIYSLFKLNIRSKFTRANLLHFFRFNLWYFVLVALISLPMILIVFHFQTSLLTYELQTRHSLSIEPLLPRFFAYLLWLGIFIGPAFLIVIFDITKRTGKSKTILLFIGVAIFTLILTQFIPISALHVMDNYLGEMNLGGIESYIPEPYLSIALFLILMVGEFFIIGIILDLKDQRSDKLIYIFLWIILPLILMSFTRAANRYMLTILIPLSLYVASIMQKWYATNKKFVLFVWYLQLIVAH